MGLISAEGHGQYCIKKLKMDNSYISNICDQTQKIAINKQMAYLVTQLYKCTTKIDINTSLFGLRVRLIALLVDVYNCTYVLYEEEKRRKKILLKALCF